jgi:hypothetical protein
MSLFQMSAGSGGNKADEGARTPLRSDAFNLDTSDPERLRAELKRFQMREAEMMELLNCKSPEKLVHDLRNVLNEMQLLRVLAKMDS